MASMKITESENKAKREEMRGHDEAWKDLREQERAKKEREQKQKTEFWKHRKDHHTGPKPKHN